MISIAAGTLGPRTALAARMTMPRGCGSVGCVAYCLTASCRSLLPLAARHEQLRPSAQRHRPAGDSLRAPCLQHSAFNFLFWLKAEFGIERGCALGSHGQPPTTR